MLKVMDVSKVFGGLQALNGVTFQVRPGEFFGLIGPNGAGKSVMVNCITGKYRPTHGGILFDGKDISHLRPDLRMRMGISRTFQHSTLFFDLPVEQNVMMGVRETAAVGLLEAVLGTGSNRRKDRQIRERTEEVLALLGLEHHRHELARNLPYGLQKVVSIGMAIASRPRLLMLDEPLTGLVAAEVNHVMKHIARLNGEGVTVFLIEHNMRAVMNYCSRIMVLSSGNKIAEGKPEEIRRDPQVIKSYLGE